MKTLKKEDLKNNKKLKQKELLIIPRKDFLNWYEFTRNQVREIEMKRKEFGSDFMECPNCRETMEDYYLKEPPKQELWHLCPHCDLTFSQKQRDYFTSLIMIVASSK